MSPAVLNALNIVQAIGYGVLTAKLLATGLASTYRYLTIRAGFECLRVILAFNISRLSDAYGYFYFATQPMLWVLDILVLLEVYTVVFSSQRGIATLSRTVISGATLFSALLAAVTFLFRPESNLSETLMAVATIERAVNISLLCFIIVLVGFLTWFPVPLSRNTLVHSTVFSVYFALRAAVSLARAGISQDIAVLLNAVVLGASVLSILVWTVGLTQRGQEVKLRSGLRRTSGDEERLIEQLESINRALIRTARD